MVLLADLTGCDWLGDADTAEKKAAHYQLEVFGDALRRYVHDTSDIPDEDCGLVSLVENCGTRSEWRGPYISKVPTDPWANKYTYRIVDRSKKSVEIRSEGSYFGANGAVGGERTPIIVKFSF